MPGDRGQDADAADGQRKRHHGAERAGALEEDRCQHHRGDSGDRIRFEQVGRHAGAIADVVTDVVGDGGRVARVILGNSGLDLADKIAADVCTLGEDAATETGKDRDQRGAEPERHHGVHNRPIIERQAKAAGENREIDGHPEERETGDQKSGDGPGFEREFKAGSERRDRRLGGAHVGAHRDVHADEAGGARQDRADRKPHCDQPAEEVADDQEDHEADDANGRVLALEIGLRAFTHGGGNLLHPGIARVRLQHGLNRPDRIDNRQQAANDDQPQS